MSITSVATSGHHISRIEAASTIGSLMGTFLTGYVLFSLIGSHAIIILISIVLVISSFLLGYTKYWLLRLIALALVILAGSLSPKPQLSGFIQQFDTAYNHVIVREIDYNSQRVRTLQTDNSSLQSGVFADGQDGLVFPYLRGFSYAAALKPQAERYLIIGGGAFTFPEFLAKQNLQSMVDTVEIDNQLPEISRQHFDFDQPQNLRIVATDGRQFLNANETKYTMIFLDAFNALVPPFQLMTAEAADRMRSSLEPDGIIAANIISAVQGYQAELMHHAYSTFKQDFAYVSVYRLKQQLPAYSRQNLLLLASNQPIDESRITQAAVNDPLLKTIIANKLSLTNNPKRVLTDDYAPLEQFAVW